MSPSKMKTREAISAAVHRALIEAHALREASMPLVITSSWDDDLPELTGISFSQDSDSNVALSFADEGLREQVLESTSRAAPEEETQVYSEKEALEKIEQDTEQANNITDAGTVEPAPLQTSGIEVDPTLETQKGSSLNAASKDHSWRNIKLDDPALKFAVCPCAP